MEFWNPKSILIASHLASYYIDDNKEKFLQYQKIKSDEVKGGVFKLNKRFNDLILSIVRRN